MVVYSPDRSVKLEIAATVRDGRSCCSYRLLKFGCVVIGRSDIVFGHGGEINGYERRLHTGGKDLAVEVSFGGKGGAPDVIFRISDDSFAVFAGGRTVASFDVKLPNTLLGAVTPIVSDDGKYGYMTVDASSFRKPKGMYDGVLFYRHGICAALLANSSLRVAVMTLGINPVGVIVPGTLRNTLFRIPEKLLRSVGTESCGDLVVDSAVQSYETVRAFLDFTFIAADFRANGIDVTRLRSCRSVHLGKSERNVVFPSDDTVSPTQAHMEAFRILTDPSAADAANGYRGEIGEYLCGARRRGDCWTVAGITTKLRVLTLFFPYLDKNVKYRATWSLDDGAVLPTNAVNPTPAVVSYGDKACVRMNPRGGFVLHLVPDK